MTPAATHAYGSTGWETVRKLVDCLIAAHAIRANLPILHADVDFDVLARNTGLLVDGARGEG